MYNQLYEYFDNILFPNFQSNVVSGKGIVLNIVFYTSGGLRGCRGGWGGGGSTPINIHEYFKNVLQHGFEIF